MNQDAADLYAIGVVKTLAGDFPDLRDRETAAIVREAVYAHAREGRLHEVIVDDPFTANWRLIPAQEQGRVRLSCWRVNPTRADAKREVRLNTALDALPA